MSLLETAAILGGLGAVAIAGQIPKWIRQRAFDRECASVFEVYDCASELFNKGDHEFQTRVRLKLYHVFEALWKEYRVDEEPDHLWLRYLFDCSDAKIEEIFRKARRELFSSSEPHTATIGEALLACSAMALLRQRRAKGTKLERYAIDRTGLVFGAALKQTPTLQIGMWELRFGEGEQKARLHPF
jgi:hypothetical protein